MMMVMMMMMMMMMTVIMIMMMMMVRMMAMVMMMMMMMTMMMAMVFHSTIRRYISRFHSASNPHLIHTRALAHSPTTFTASSTSRLCCLAFIDFCIFLNHLPRFSAFMVWRDCNGGALGSCKTVLNGKTLRC